MKKHTLKKNNKRTLKKLTNKKKRKSTKIKTENKQQGNGISTNINVNPVLPLTFYRMEPNIDNNRGELYSFAVNNIKENKESYNCIKLNKNLKIEEYRLNTESISDNFILTPSYSGSFYFTELEILNLTANISSEFEFCHYYICNRNHKNLSIILNSTKILENKPMYHLIFKDGILKENIY